MEPDQDPGVGGASERTEGSGAERIQGHLRFGWWSLAVFVAFGLVLETFHGFKLQLYLDVANDTRRLMWSLAHAHGTLLSSLHLGFAYTLGRLPSWRGGSMVVASRLLTAATVLMPLGFFLGGLDIHSGDPGVGVVLVAPGGLLLLGSVVITARQACRR